LRTRPCAVGENRVEHPGHAFLARGRHRDLRRLAAAGVEGAKIDKQAVRAGDEGADLVRRNRHRRHAAGSQQYIGGEVLRHGVGNAMDARVARAHALKQRAGSLDHVVARGFWRPHLSFPPPA